jgi:hypothetical protein
MQILEGANHIDHIVDGVMKSRRRYVNRFFRWLINRNPLETYLPKMPNIRLEELRAIPEYAQLLRSENYSFWQGELSRYNYSFD